MRRGLGNPMRPTSPEAWKADRAKTIQTRFASFRTQLQKEGPSVFFAPLPAARRAEIRAYAEQMKNAADEAKAKNEPARGSRAAWELWEAMQDDFTEGLDVDYQKKFLAWLLGKGLEQDHKKTPWGREPHALELPEVRAWLDQIIDSASFTESYLLKLLFRGPQSLDEYAIYYKYLLHMEEYLLVDDQWIFVDFPKMINGGKLDKDGQIRPPGDDQGVLPLGSFNTKERLRRVAKIRKQAAAIREEHIALEIVEKNLPAGAEERAEKVKQRKEHLTEMGKIVMELGDLAEYEKEKTKLDAEQLQRQSDLAARLNELKAAEKAAQIIEAEKAEREAAEAKKKEEERRLKKEQAQKQKEEEKRKKEEAKEKAKQEHLEKRRKQQEEAIKEQKRQEEARKTEEAKKQQEKEERQKRRAERKAKALEEQRKAEEETKRRDEEQKAKEQAAAKEAAAREAERVELERRRIELEAAKVQEAEKQTIIAEKVLVVAEQQLKATEGLEVILATYPPKRRALPVPAPPVGPVHVKRIAEASEETSRERQIQQQSKRLSQSIEEPRYANIPEKIAGPVAMQIDPAQPMQVDDPFFAKDVISSSSLPGEFQEYKGSASSASSESGETRTQKIRDVDVNALKSDSDDSSFSSMIIESTSSDTSDSPKRQEKEEPPKSKAKKTSKSSKKSRKSKKSKKSKK